MKYAYLLFALVLAAGLQAQTTATYEWASLPGTACDGTTAELASGLDDFSYHNGCAQIEVLGQGLSARLSSTDDGYITLAGSNYAVANVLPGSQGEYGTLSFEVTGLEGLGDPARSQFNRLTVNVYGYQSAQVFTVGLDEALTSSCSPVVEGGSQLELAGLELQALAAVSADFTITYTYTPVDAVSVLTELSVPASDFNGSSYEHDLPQGSLYVYPVRGDLRIGLEQNTPTAQEINVYKSEGDIVFPRSVEVVAQRAFNSEEHRVNLFLEGVELCLGNSEVIVNEGNSLTLSGVDIGYDAASACLGTADGGRISIAPSARQVLGNDGLGLQMLHTDSPLSIGEDATLVFDCGLVVRGTDPLNEDTYIDVAPGGRLEVTRNATDYGATAPESIVVRLAEGASFDASRAPREVQRLFRVEQVSSTADALPAGSFALSPNPAQASGEVFVSNAGSTVPAAAIELIDATGRVLTHTTGQLSGNRHAVQLPGAGLYTVRVTDVEGRMAHLRVVGQ